MLNLAIIMVLLICILYVHFGVTVAAFVLGCCVSYIVFSIKQTLNESEAN